MSSSASLTPPLREGRVRRFVALLGLSVLLHSFLSPLPLWLGWFASWMQRSEEPPPSTPLETIPVDLISDLAEPAQPAPAEPPAELAPPKPAVSQSKTSPVESPTRPPKKPSPTPAAPEPVSPVAEHEKAQPELADPSMLTGEAGRVADRNANVQLLIYNQPIREHVLGRRLGKLLTELPQWESFFEPTRIDPVQDIDTIFIAGPQFRRSSDVVAVLGHHLPDARMRAALETLVERPPRGEWLRQGERPAARAYADRAERVFVAAASGMLLVAPLSAEKSALSVRLKPFPKPQHQRAVVAKIKTPWRALLGTGLDIPKSLEVLHLELTPTDGGAADLRISAVDANPEAALEHARALTLLVNQLTSGGGFLFFLFGEPLLDPVKLTASGKSIHGQVLIRPSQLERLLNLVESWLEANTRRPREPVRSPSGASGASSHPRQASPQATQEAPVPSAPAQP